MRADIWALGVVLYELLTGKLPFVAETMPELVGMILQNGYTPAAALRPDVPPGLQAAIDRCLQKDRAHRYRNVAELAAGIVPFGPPRSDLSLERISHVLGLTSGVDETISASMAPAAVVAAQTFSPMISSDAKPPRRRLLWLVPAPLLVIAACVGIFFAWTHSIRPAPLSTATAPGVMAPAAPTGSAEPAAPTIAPTAMEATATATAASVAPLPAPTVLEPPALPRAASTARRPTTTPAPSASAAPTCHTVSYFDTEGNRHFRQECP